MQSPSTPSNAMTNAPYKFQMACSCEHYTAKPRARFASPILTPQHNEELASMVIQHQGATNCGGGSTEDSTIWCFKDDACVNWVHEHDAVANNPGSSFVPIGAGPGFGPTGIAPIPVIPDARTRSRSPTIFHRVQQWLHTLPHVADIAEINCICSAAIRDRR